MRIERFLDALAGKAIEDTLGVKAPAILRPTQDPKHGDYQVNGVMPLAKQQKRPPRELAEKVAEALRSHEAIAEATVAGPGFLNIRLADAWIAARLAESLKDARDGVPESETKQKIVVDYSSPNIAKQMHVGHLRSTIIGHALVQLLRFQGHEVIGDNHLGDWGTQYGLLIAGLRAFGGGDAAVASLSLAQLEGIYVEAKKRAKDDESFADEARRELAKLQSGDAANRALWERFVAITRAENDKVYERLGVSFDWWKGESFYEPMLPGVVDELLAKGLAREDQGAICIFFNELENVPNKLAKQKTPFLIRKKDGAFLYSTSDIATVEHRKSLGVERSIYVVDSRQSQHFEQLFGVVQMLGIQMQLEHVGFGMVLGSSGTALATREGNALTLASLLDEAEARAAVGVREQGIDISEQDMPKVARAVGIGAVKYSDLRQNRLSDYQFDFDKLIEFKGNAGPYLQYAATRGGSIFRTGGIDLASFAPASITLTEPAELALARQLAKFADVVHAAADTCQPHLLCDHLYAVASDFSRFYEACQVLKSEGATRESRLALTAITSRQLRRGLTLLGIEVLERM
ncbi:arginine--tRNA ligase [Sandaracinus amylolyticus]|uniref:Arginine--tRNA ligase n=1 Tax=Sandaracinus amylolyticus TaxID=927083 RepID=A0A0F6SFY4_9BACT|nr:arginine--tRNA ligase [Sandaracinus amylolyticus]AKF07749.1 Arginyl-tRNA synthetase [Sandaracinus amylolyticus]